VTDELAFLERVMGTYKGVREPPEQRSFLAQTFTGSRGQVLPYRMLMPPAYPAHAEARGHDVGRDRMPLVLLLHGVGERGNDNSAQLSNGVAELLGSDTAPCCKSSTGCWVSSTWPRWPAATTLRSCWAVWGGWRRPGPSCAPCWRSSNACRAENWLNKTIRKIRAPRELEENILADPRQLSHLMSGAFVPSADWYSPTSPVKAVHATGREAMPRS
jgi:hypothetical protein